MGTLNLYLEMPDTMETESNQSPFNGMGWGVKNYAIFLFFGEGGDGVIKISLEGRGIKTGQKRIAKFLTLPYQCASSPLTCIIQHLSVLNLHRFCFCTENRNPCPAKEGG